MNCVVMTPVLAVVFAPQGAFPPELSCVGAAQWKAENPGLEVRSMGCGFGCNRQNLCKQASHTQWSPDLSLREGGQ